MVMKKYTRVSMVGWMALERNQRQPEVRIPSKKDTTTSSSKDREMV
jgi:hypothetical protein